MPPDCGGSLGAVPGWDPQLGLAPRQVLETSSTAGAQHRGPSRMGRGDEGTRVWWGQDRALLPLAPCLSNPSSRQQTGGSPAQEARQGLRPSLSALPHTRAQGPWQREGSRDRQARYPAPRRGGMLLQQQHLDPDPGVSSATPPMPGWDPPPRLTPPSLPPLRRRFPLRVPGAHFHQQQLLLQPQGPARRAGGGTGRLDAPGLVAPTPTCRGAAARGRSSLGGRTLATRQHLRAAAPGAAGRTPARRAEAHPDPAAA